jgi:hypothetical protein
VTVQTGNEIGSAICDALGLNANLIHTIRIEMTVGEVAEVTTIGYADPKRSVAKIMRHYTVVKRAGWPPPWPAPRLGDVYYKPVAR